MNKVIKNHKGATAILLTLLITMAMLFIAVTASDIIRNGLSMSQAHLHSTKAYYGAESGTERILWEIRKHNADPIADAPGVWDDGECVKYSSGYVDTTNSTDTCGNPGTEQTLASNGVKYTTEYSETLGSPNIIGLKSIGNYKGITQRAVEVGYTD